MNQETAIKIFENRQVRTIWNEEEEEWYFSVVDVVGVRTDSVNPTDYLKKLRKRDELLGEYLGTNCPQVEMKTETGKKRKILAANVKDLFRIIQSIPSPKAEPFKLWMAEVAKERLDQLQDPELSIELAMTDYKRLGYSDNWINQRLKSIEIRKELTDEWKRHGLQEGQQFASLTDIITKTWSGKTTKEYKRYKGLKKEGLRDNMTNMELVLNMLAELSTKQISETSNPETFNEHAQVAKQGGEIAHNARKELELKTGKSAISSLNAKSGMMIGKGGNLELPYRTEFSDVTYLNDLNVVFVTWKKFCQKDDYRTPLLYALEIMRNHKDCHYVADTRDGFENEPDDTKWLFDVFLPEAAKTDCKKIFFIVDETNALKSELEGQATELTRFFDVHYCFNLDDVKAILSK
jgi:prophage antirepressor-like protein